MDLRVACVTFTLTLLLVLSCYTQTTSGQAYHFSNGWFPGKKRSGGTEPVSSPLVYNSGTEDGAQYGRYYRPAPPSGAARIMALYSSLSSSASGALAPSCEIRPQVQQIIMELLQSEVQRMASDCRPASTADSRRGASDGNSKTQDLSRWIERLRNYRDNES